MKDSELRMIETMLKKQSKLDESIMSAYGLTEIDRENLDMAILDEIGELTHELKGEWCWWKKTQAPVDDEKVLGELVDIWHFVLSWQNNFNGGEEELLNSCKQYNVDMRIHAFERGMQFNQIIEIIDGKITKDEEVEFDDYDWDCICPNLGG